MLGLSCMAQGTWQGHPKKQQRGSGFSALGCGCGRALCCTVALEHGVVRLGLRDTRGHEQCLAPELWPPVPEEDE